MEEIGSKIPVDSLLFGVRMFVISYAQYRWDLLHRQLKNALNKLGVFLSDESVQTSPQACFHGEGSEFS